MTGSENLAYFGGPKTIEEKDAKFEWPPIDDECRAALEHQLNDTISIYDNSSVFGAFESEFAEYHGPGKCILSNSGTSSILAMFDSIELRPGDEVLCPSYTFHATVSPLMNYGAIPVFCDCDRFGNMSIEDVERKANQKTKALIITHMWGEPAADTARISDFCRSNGIWMFEDCSHAHGAQINGQKVGTFGDAAAWSLQGQKIITGGEGGILYTTSEQIFSKALIHGHYNKRPKTELDEGDELRKFFLTGKGLKLRAHPLAIALARVQFGRLDSYLHWKRKYAAQIAKAVSAFDFVEVRSSPSAEPSFYALGLHFLQEKAPHVTKQQLLELLLAEGLIEADIPGSTGILNEVPLFSEPNTLFPSLYSTNLPVQPAAMGAKSFVQSFLKIPVWALSNDQATMNKYQSGIQKVCSAIASDPDLGNKMQART